MSPIDREHFPHSDSVSVPYVTDRWVKIQTIVDLEDDWTRIYYDDELIDLVARKLRNVAISHRTRTASGWESTLVTPSMSVTVTA